MEKSVGGNFDFSAEASSHHPGVWIFLSLNLHVGYDLARLTENKENIRLQKYRTKLIVFGIQ